jgi:hypothetical protein
MLIATTTLYLWTLLIKQQALDIGSPLDERTIGKINLAAPYIAQVAQEMSTQFTSRAATFVFNKVSYEAEISCSWPQRPLTINEAPSVASFLFNNNEVRFTIEYDGSTLMDSVFDKNAYNNNNIMRAIVRKSLRQYGVVTNNKTPWFIPIPVSLMF